MFLKIYKDGSWIVLCHSLQMMLFLIPLQYQWESFQAWVSSYWFILLSKVSEVSENKFSVLCTFVLLLKQHKLGLNNGIQYSDQEQKYRKGRLETESGLTCGSKHVIFKRGQTDVSPNWRKQNCILQTWLQLIESGMQKRRGSELFYYSVMYTVLFLGLYFFSDFYSLTTFNIFL